jgi:glycosyltransferase involved in cell wall biosynthesis
MSRHDGERPAGQRPLSSVRSQPGAYRRRVRSAVPSSEALAETTSTKTQGFRIAVVHSFYSSRAPSGENAVVEAEMRALLRAGHRVELFAAHTDELEQRPLYGLSSALRVSSGVGRSPLPELEDFAPDVTHIHNLFPNWGRRWVASLESPFVATLHNFRTICSNGLLFRDDSVCTRCPDGSSLSAVRYACYRDSRIATTPLAFATRRAPAANPVLRYARRIIVLSQVAREIYMRYGVPAHKLTVWSNFLDAEADPGWTGESASGDYWLFVGRLGREKGVVPLVEAWPSDTKLVLVGDGPERAAVQRAAQGKHIDMLGLQPRADAIELMRSATGLVFPSRCFESFPMVYTEAMATGLPVLAWDPNVVAAMVQHQGTGMATRSSDDLAVTLSAAADLFPSLRKRCREVFEEQLSERAYLRRAESLYIDVMDPTLPRTSAVGSE